jgi:hypothetical protein
MNISLTAKDWAAVSAAAVIGIVQIASQSVLKTETAAFSLPIILVTIGLLAYVIIYIIKQVGPGKNDNREPVYRVLGHLDGLKDYKHDIERRRDKTNDVAEKNFLTKMSDELESQIRLLKRTYRNLTTKNNVRS